MPKMTEFNERMRSPELPSIYNEILNLRPELETAAKQKWEAWGGSLDQLPNLYYMEFGYNLSNPKRKTMSPLEALGGRWVELSDIIFHEQTNLIEIGIDDGNEEEQYCALIGLEMPAILVNREDMEADPSKPLGELVRDAETKLRLTDVDLHTLVDTIKADSYRAQPSQGF